MHVCLTVRLWKRTSIVYRVCDNTADDPINDSPAFLLNTLSINPACCYVVMTPHGLRCDLLPFFVAHIIRTAGSIDSPSNTFVIKCLAVAILLFLALLSSCFDVLVCYINVII